MEIVLAILAESFEDGFRLKQAESFAIALRRIIRNSAISNSNRRR
jgi:hypothetical protein